LNSSGNDKSIKTGMGPGIQDRVDPAKDVPSGYSSNKSALTDSRDKVKGR
jgi:hypothetical protein